MSTRRQISVMMIAAGDTGDLVLVASTGTLLSISIFSLLEETPVSIP